MVDKKSGWVLESFDKNWNYQRAANDQREINVGHNIETAWSLARLHRLNNREDYLHAATVLSDSLHHYGFNSQKGFWFASIGNDDPARHSEDTYWWIQAYGNMFDLYLAGLHPQQNYTKHFLKGAAFWDTYFLDKEKGDTHLSVLESGEVKDFRKANQFKSSYHNMEHCLLNYFYLGCWVNPEPLTLYFKITSAREGEKLYPLPIEKLNALIKEVTINGKAYGIEGAEQGMVTLPALSDASVAITMYS
jgi:mannose/cellobiose epimerase-like protein (N-acyl-D-glucosamine 2-epimerase family)